MTDKEKIREQANIDIYNLRVAQEEGIITEFGKGKLEALEGIIDFIDTLQEEPVSNDLEEAANDYAHDIVHDDVFENFIAGAQWQKEQMMGAAIKGIARPLDDEVWCDGDEFPKNIQDGDKVKLIIIKEEQL